jgi:hypothetical protein
MIVRPVKATEDNSLAEKIVASLTYDNLMTHDNMSLPEVTAASGDSENPIIVQGFLRRKNRVRIR